jgi:hypothetical protein
LSYPLANRCLPTEHPTCCRSFTPIGGGVRNGYLLLGSEGHAARVVVGSYCRLPL